MGVVLVRRVLSKTLRLTEQIFWGTVVGWVLSTAAAYVAARAFGRLSLGIILTTIVSAWLLALILLRPDLKLFRQLQFKNRWRRAYAGLAIVELVLAPILWRVFSAQIFASGVGGIYSGGSSYDLSFHAAVASSFAYGANFPPLYTPLPPEPLLYPPLPDFHAAMLMTLGWSIRSAFIFTALPLALALVGLFYFLALRVSRSVRAAVIATFLFFFNGGLGFTYFFRDCRANGRGLIDMLLYPPANYSNNASLGLHWVNVIADGLAPQPTTLYALPMAFMILPLLVASSDWFGSGDAKNDRGEWRLSLVAGLLAGSLCYLQPHVAMATMIIAIGLFLLRPRRMRLAFFMVTALISIPFLITTLSHATTSGFMRFQPGWLGRDEPHPIVYWLRNLGLPLLLVMPAFFAAPRHARRFYLPFVVVMLVAVLFVLSPNDYDNLKLMLMWYAATAVVIAMWLARLTAVKWLTPVVAVVVLVCIASGLLASRRGMIEHDLMFTDEQIQASDFIRNHTLPRSLFLSAPTFQDAVLSLAGRSIVRGSTSWLWSHGYNFQDREADVRRIYAGAAAADALIRYYQIDYVYLGNAEKSELKADTNFFDSRYPLVFHSSSISIYDTRGDRTSVGALEKPAPRELASRVELDPYALLTDFPRTSLFVYSLCKVTYGRMPTRQEMIGAMKKLGRGVYIGAPGWETQLDLNRLALLKEWTEGEAFKRTYDARSNAEFVDSISRNASKELTGEARDGLISRLQAGESRANLLRSFVEDKDLSRREYNTAFVLMHFFGYLGRDPGAAPDHDLSGFNFWVSNLDKTRDYRALSRAFLESSEYQNRIVR